PSVRLWRAIAESVPVGDGCSIRSAPDTAGTRVPCRPSYRHPPRYGSTTEPASGTARRRTGESPAHISRALGRVSRIPFGVAPAVLPVASTDSHAAATQTITAAATKERTGPIVDAPCRARIRVGACKSYALRA